MIEIDVKSKTYVCPFCGNRQAFAESSKMELITYSPVYGNHKENPYLDSSFYVYTIKCTNQQCKQISVVAFNLADGTQVDILPQGVHKQYPDYIPEQIRADYEEACLIIENSPKAAATLLRRCLQGMIHDFWNIHEKNLNAEITSLKEKVSFSQWNAIDGLRKLGNIGAHMENDVNVIIDIDADEAQKLLHLIELLLDKWYVSRHDEEELCSDVLGIAESKEELRKSEN